TYCTARTSPIVRYGIVNRTTCSPRDEDGRQRGSAAWIGLLDRESGDRHGGRRRAVGGPATRVGDAAGREREQRVEPARHGADDRVAADGVIGQLRVRERDEELAALAVRVVTGASHGDRARGVDAVGGAVLDRTERVARIGGAEAVERA